MVRYNANHLEKPAPFTASVATSRPTYAWTGALSLGGRDPVEILTSIAQVASEAIGSELFITTRGHHSRDITAGLERKVKSHLLFREMPGHVRPYADLIKISHDDLADRTHAIIYPAAGEHAERYEQLLKCFASRLS